MVGWQWLQLASTHRSNQPIGRVYTLAGDGFDIVACKFPLNRKLIIVIIIHGKAQIARIVCL